MNDLNFNYLDLSIAFFFVGWIFAFIFSDLHFLIFFFLPWMCINSCHLLRHCLACCTIIHTNRILSMNSLRHDYLAIKIDQRVWRGFVIYDFYGGLMMELPPFSVLFYHFTYKIYLFIFLLLKLSKCLLHFHHLSQEGVILINFHSFRRKKEQVDALLFYGSLHTPASRWHLYLNCRNNVVHFEMPFSTPHTTHLLWCNIFSLL